MSTQASHERAGAPACTPLAELRPRRRQRVAGSLVALTIPPRSDTPALVGRLADGTGTVDVIWLGRRTIPGIEPGRRIVAEGMVADGPRGATIYNPAYELEATEAAQ